MQIFQLLVLKIIPLYLLILLGYLAAKKLKTDKDTIGKILLYIIGPVVVFYGGLLNPITTSNLILPLLVFLVASIVSITFYQFGKYIFPKSSDRNLLAYAAGASNTGYFGLPVVAAVLGGQAFTLAILADLGMIIYANTIGFYLAAKGNYSAKESLIKIARLPHLYALALGILLNYSGLPKGEILLANFEYFKGSYTLLGMMIIGMGLANIKFVRNDYHFVALIFFAKFLVSPLLVLGLILIDGHLAIGTKMQHQVLLIICCTPLAANTVVIAGELKLNPAKAALGVLVSTIFALIYIPLIIQLL